ncbi:MAG: peptidase M14 [Bacteroidetes bacterium CG_4_10_14_3_um_filter_42_6]|nr:MAG: peptidase M14 [Bacteroidetes bacterium CG_4_10_14_3_um_filter_42_6]
MKYGISFWLIAIVLVTFGQQTDWTTYFEKHQYNGTPRYDETMEFCRRLAQNSPFISLDTVGISPQGRPIVVVIIDKNGHHTEESVRQSGNAVLLVQSAIHAGEPDGKDAMLQWLRDMVAYQKHVELLNHVTILWIPILNVDGHERYGAYSRINQNGPEEMGWRANAQNLNLNRDYMKAETPEIQLWLKLFNHWLPDFFIDCHTTDGADYQYPITHSMEIYGNMDPGLTAWQKDTYLPVIEAEMEKSGFPVFQYVSFRRWHDPRSGLYATVALPRLSEGYTALQNRPGLLIETHMLKPYRIRVESTERLILVTLEMLNNEYQNLKKLNLQADEFSASEAFRKLPLAIGFTTDYSDSVMVDFKGIDYDRVTSDLSGGDWFRYGNTPTLFSLPMFDRVVPNETVKLPEAYIIPPQWTLVIEKLQLHGVEFYTLKNSVETEVNLYTFSDYSWQQQPSEGKHPMTKLKLTENAKLMKFPAGSVVVPVNQRRARVIANILEPKASDSYVYWGYFDAITEQKEYSESYSMETIACQMLTEDPDLQATFDLWKQNNPVLSENSYAILNWFYQQSPWWDQQKDLYPIGRIMSKSQIPNAE